MAISRIRTCQRLKFCFHTSNLIGLPKIWNSAPALPFGWLPMMWHEICSTLLLCQFFVRCEVPLPHFRPAWLATIWSSASAHQLCSVRTFKVWSFASAIPLCLYCQRSEVPLSVLPLGQDFERSRSTSALVLPGLPNMGKSISAFHLCRDFQRCEVTLPHFCAALIAKDLKFRFPYFRSPGLERSRSSSTFVLPGLPNVDKSTSAFHLCQDFQTSEIPLPHFCFALTAKDVKFCFLSSAVRSCYAFPHKFVRL